MKEKELSTINLPISVSISEIEDSINNRLQGVIYEDKSLENNEGDNLMLKVERHGSVSIFIVERRIDYSLPLKIWAKKDIGISMMKASGEITLNFSTSFEIKEDWQLSTITKVINHQWHKKPIAHLGILKVPIKFIGERALKKSRAIIENAVDQELQSQFDLRKLVVEAWYQLQQPIILSKEFDFWLAIQPEELGMTDFLVEQDSFTSKIIIRAETKANIGIEPVPMSSFLLPPYQLITEENERFNLRLSTFIPFEEAEKIAIDHLAGESFTSGSQKINIEQIKLFGEGDKIIVDARISGSFTGDILLSGKPVYNVDSNLLELEDLTYEINTRSILMQGASWLFKKEIEKRLKKELKFPLKQNLEKLEKIVELELENFAITPNIFLRGDLHEINVEHTQIESKGIRVIVASSGKLKLLIKGFLHE